jgi:hypothetical protein
MARIRDFSYIRKKVFAIMVAWLALFMPISREISGSMPASAWRFPVLPALAFAPMRVSGGRGAFLAGERLADHPLLWFGDGRITAGHLAVLRERGAAGGGREIRVSYGAGVTTTSSRAGSAAAPAPGGARCGCLRRGGLALDVPAAWEAVVPQRPPRRRR